MKTPEDLLKDLLAVIHRDGGHHTTAVGLEQSVNDAMHAVVSWRERIERAAVDIREILRAPSHPE